MESGLGHTRAALRLEARCTPSRFTHVPTITGHGMPSDSAGSEELTDLGACSRR